MTLTSHSPVRPASRHPWVPPAAGWTIGVIATLSLVASLSSTVRGLIKIPREFVNDYIFNFPDTSFAWAFVLALLAGALAARKRIAWWILLVYMVASVGWNIGGLLSREGPAAEHIGELIGLTFHLTAVVFLILARNEFWAKVRRGALFKAAAVVLTGMACPRRPSPLCGQSRQRVRRGRSRAVQRPSAGLRQCAARPLRSAGPDGRRDCVVPVPALRQRTHL
jgi:lysyl-tRNA synthetase, class II